MPNPPDQLTPVLAGYRAAISRGQFESVEWSLRVRGPIEFLEGALPWGKLERGATLFAELRDAVASYDLEGSMRALERLRIWLHWVEL